MNFFSVIVHVLCVIFKAFFAKLKITCISYLLLHDKLSPNLVA